MAGRREGNIGNYMKRDTQQLEEKLEEVDHGISLCGLPSV
jgi:hypothetical protein